MMDHQVLTISAMEMGKLLVLGLNKVIVFPQYSKICSCIFVSVGMLKKIMNILVKMKFRVLDIQEKARRKKQMATCQVESKAIQ